MSASKIDQLIRELQLMKLAQEILDVSRPGETVQEIIINTNTATALAQPTPEVETPETRRVYCVMYMPRDSEKEPWASYDVPDNEFETWYAAESAKTEINRKYPYGTYFVQSFDVPA